MILTIAEKLFLDRAAAQAVKANHPFPRMAACEAALESGWGHSELARVGNNLFGTKQHCHPIYGTMTLPTREFEHAPGTTGEWEVVSAHWVVYPDWRACFCDRLATLERLSNVMPHYKAALEAKDERTYIEQVSLSWATDPARAAKVLDVFQAWTAPRDVTGGTPEKPAAGS